MSEGITKFKPGASVPTHLLTAAFMWSLIGFYLMVRGYKMHGWQDILLPLLSIAVGVVKSLLVLDKSARRNIERILSFQDGTCIGGVYSWKMWGLVVCMMLFGRFLRTSGISPALVGCVYLAVGAGLFFSSRLLWQKWQSLRREDVK